MYAYDEIFVVDGFYASVALSLSCYMRFLMFHIPFSSFYMGPSPHGPGPSGPPGPGLAGRRAAAEHSQLTQPPRQCAQG